MPSWLGLRRLSVLVLMQTISTLKVQLDAASYVADIVTFALKAPSKTWFVKTMLRMLGLRRSR